MWEDGSKSFGQPRTGEGTIQDKIKHWEGKFFMNAIVRRLWDLLLGFVVWNIWKEHNNQIFEGKRQPPREIWAQIKLQITETLGLHLWSPSDLKASPTEARILECWGIGSIPAYIRPNRINKSPSNSLEVWEPTPPNPYTN